MGWARGEKRRMDGGWRLIRGLCQLEKIGSLPSAKLVKRSLTKYDFGLLRSFSEGRLIHSVACESGRKGRRMQSGCGRESPNGRAEAPDPEPEGWERLLQAGDKGVVVAEVLFVVG